MKEIDTNNLKAFLKRDAIYLIALLFALLCCMIVLLDVGNYQEACNNHFKEQWEEKCSCLAAVKPLPFNVSYSDVNIIAGLKNGD